MTEIQDHHLHFTESHNIFSIKNLSIYLQFTNSCTNSILPIFRASFLDWALFCKLLHIFWVDLCFLVVYQFDIESNTCFFNNSKEFKLLAGISTQVLILMSFPPSGHQIFSASILLFSSSSFSSSLIGYIFSFSLSNLLSSLSCRFS